jgi:hypothetical protein
MSTPEAVSITPTKKKDSEERISVASQWTLIWWRFKKHRLALIFSGALIFLYLVVLIPDFFATEDPEYTNAQQSFIPPRPLYLFDNGQFRGSLGVKAHSKRCAGMGRRSEQRCSSRVLCARLQQILGIIDEHPSGKCQAIP